ncbi:TPA: hypothetical protein KR288_002483 [Clostridioides difficile]|uniref:hypothetical protein n=1 Tax=Clostridioides difficile TaxID=1496 RepID=UPI001C170685|nr:hypothetical protein [Clostridioides difficile]MDY6558479.1 hypothetical protein [Clostridioides difficile]MDY6690662.1 hypothetical protein [Clostridioides difficile]HBF0668635.1 hypothetical protein [Clostridioides difficile]HBF4141925.1 hypothetical protein [Clostridioides difficile]HBF4922951.1 hypothetical protein [Clostridioides difficile]
MDRIYFAKNKDMKDFYIGNGNKIGFKTLGSLRASLTLKNKNIEQYDLYYIDLNFNIHKFVDWEKIK